MCWSGVTLFSNIGIDWVLTPISSHVNDISHRPEFMNRSSIYTSNLLLLLISTGFALPCYALELEPRTWSHLPLGSSFAGGAYAYTEADIFVDPALQLEDVEMKLDTVAVKYIQTFELLGKSARIDITQAYQKGRWSGLLGGAPATTKRSGWSDTFVRFAANLSGGPPLKGKEFTAYRAKVKDETIVGAGLAIRLPTGDYMDDKLINLGQNRFAIRPQIGVVMSRGKWSTEVTAEVAFYTDNDDFYNGKKLEQKPLLFTQAHLTRNLGPGEWASLGVGFNYGGENTIDGDDKDNRSHNIGWALSYSYPISRQAGIKIVYANSQTQESTGLDTETLALAIAFAW